MKFNKEHLDEIKAFDFSIKYIEIYSNSPENEYNSHIHEECEIYINVSGDVSFIVENNVYPIKPGDIIITRPCEYHHLVYHSDKLHKHFWILFSSAGNEYLLDSFFNRKAGNSNLLSLSPEETNKLFALCHKMTQKEPDVSKRYYNFFSLINILKTADVVTDTYINFPKDTLYALEYINNHFKEALSVTKIAASAHVSTNTLERHFMQALDITPSEYIKKKRLANASKLLLMGHSVAEASTQSGFSDYSKFISFFKKHYGITPLKYQKKERTSI